ncbi:poly(A)-specific ribonuclease [Ranunculus cassubicifolius]
MKKRWTLIKSFSQTLTLLTKPSFLSRSFSSSNFSVKKITKNNFNSSLQTLKHHVSDADFVSIDLEMTGVTSAPWRESFDFDRSDIRYLKVKDSAEKFAVVQFGICSFRWDNDKESFIAHPYTFYVFPRKEIAVDGLCYEFLCQTSSMDFLAKYQFDFNAWIYEGISYLSRANEAEALNYLTPVHEDDSHMKGVTESPSVGVVDILFSERMKNQFSEWRNSLLQNTDGRSQFDANSINYKAQLQTVFFLMHPALELNDFTSHQLRLIQLVIQKHFKDLIYIRVTCEDTSERKLIVFADSEDGKHLIMKEARKIKRKEVEMKVEAAVGFRHVIDLLSAEKKLIVGHNCFLDVAHIHSKFLGPLPSTIEQFASTIHKHFANIIDTKYLLSTDNVLRCLMKKNSTSLSKAFAFLCPQVSLLSGSSSTTMKKDLVNFEVQVDEMSSSNWNSGAKHEAGYDAFMTGCIFAQACSHLGINFKTLPPLTPLADNEKLQKYTNHLYISWRYSSIVDISTGKLTAEYNIKQKYPKIIFENIVLLWGFPVSLKPGTLKDCFTKVFGVDNVTNIYYFDKNAAFVQFGKKKFVYDFLALKETLEKKNDAVSVLNPIQKILDGGKTRAADYEVYKEICGSLISKGSFEDQANEVYTKKAESLVVKKCGNENVGENKMGKNVRLSCVELMDTLLASEGNRVGNCSSI